MAATEGHQAILAKGLETRLKSVASTEGERSVFWAIREKPRRMDLLDS